MKSLPGRILLFVTTLFLLITGFYAYRCWEVSRCDPFGLADPGMVYEPVLEVGFRDRLHFHMRTKDGGRMDYSDPLCVHLWKDVIFVADRRLSERGFDVAIPIHGYVWTNCVFMLNQDEWDVEEARW